jgi:hypothetical protein
MNAETRHSVQTQHPPKIMNTDSVNSLALPVDQKTMPRLNAESMVFKIQSAHQHM